MKLFYLGCLLTGQLFSYTLKSQYYFSANNQPEGEWMWELAASAGAMNCLTDIGGSNSSGKKFISAINWNQSRFCGGLFASATWHAIAAVRLQANAGQATGNDDVLKNSNGLARTRYYRHLQFRTTVAELSLTGELHLLPLLNRARDLPLFSPYITAGIGCFYYNPQAMINNIWVDLRPLRTEGQGFTEYPDRTSYKSLSWCLPVGAGVKYDAARQVNIRVELLYRFTGTDYLDDVSTRYIDPILFRKYLPATEAAMAEKLSNRSGTVAGDIVYNKDAVRGNPANKDAYFSLLFSISIALGRIQRK